MCCARPSAWASPMGGWRVRGGSKGRRKVRHLRKKHGVMPVYKRVDTCAAEFESFTPYLYSTYEDEDEAAPTDKKKDHHSRQRAQPHRAGN